MGSIVSFTPRQVTRHRRSEDKTVIASVIIFPGVRYERTSGTLPADDESARALPGPIKPESSRH